MRSSTDLLCLVVLSFHPSPNMHTQCIILAYANSKTVSHYPAAVLTMVESDFNADEPVARFINQVSTSDEYADDFERDSDVSNIRDLDEHIEGYDEKEDERHYTTRQL